MKKALFLIILTFVSISFCKAADQKDIFSAKEIVWLGLDFSHIKLIGEDFKDLKEIKEVFFKSWNDLILKEEKKYSLGKFFHKETVVNDLSTLEKVNETVKTENLRGTSPYNIDKSYIQDAIKDYYFAKKNGIAVFLFMESFNKTTETGTMWVTFIDLASKKVLLADKMEGKSGGIGFRNYWAKTFYNVLKDCQKKYDIWKLDYDK